MPLSINRKLLLNKRHALKELKALKRGRLKGVNVHIINTTRDYVLLNGELGIRQYYHTTKKEALMLYQAEFVSHLDSLLNIVGS